MSGQAAAAVGERPLRLFCALRLPAASARVIVAWQQRLRSGGRLVAPDQLHLTLAFLGAVPATSLATVSALLAEVAAAAAPIRLELAGYREHRRGAMLTFHDLEGHGGMLAAALGEALEREGLYRRERRRWLPHVTVLRYSQAPALGPELPPLGAFSPSDAAVYSSSLRRQGAQYEVLEAMRLGG